ncbi:plastocyanin/azurin family copper-binding protein [Halomicrococcus sp. NG-SE-24]
MGLHREVTGTYLYYCDPHRSLGMKVAVVVEK